MATCVGNLLKGIGSFILGSLRMILFFGCVIFAFCSILSLYAHLRFLHQDDFIDLPGLRASSPRDILVSLFLLFIGIVGCYGSFYKHHQSIRFFALSTALVSSILILSAIFASPINEQEEMREFKDGLTEAMGKYNWDHRPAHMEDRDKATKTWDTMQAMFCCGVNGPKDWSKSRPKDVDSDKYPPSCCSNIYDPFKRNELCDASDHHFFKTGCMERISQINCLAVTVEVLSIVFLMILSIISGVLSCCGIERFEQPRVGSVHVETRGPNQYQRFDGSVYVRQPAQNQDYRPVGDKAPLPSIYPSVGDATTYQSPPPGYTSK